MDGHVLRAPAGPAAFVWGPGEEPRGSQGGSSNLAFVLKVEPSLYALSPSTLSRVFLFDLSSRR